MGDEHRLNSSARAIWPSIHSMHLTMTPWVVDCRRTGVVGTCNVRALAYAGMALCQPSLTES
eukprot:6179157-Pleurochrysis_carterae.AAC.2